jgi:hypothetical protein|uniref:ORF1 n=1 Tax=Leuconostoc mesenteroides TaxID=1245 RepID=Q4L0R4_LEUME|nr:hypothetical protein [Leuconostoc mesenteroides]AAV65048.1 ORF1 [Leuconostoc mesenteroides]
MSILKIHDEAEYSKSYLYETWKNQQQNNYFLLSNNIIEYLKLIKNPAMNLYLFYVSKSNNKQGYSTWSINNISEILNTSIKTLTNWNSTLQDAGLILRIPRRYNSYKTQLLPTSDFTISIDSKVKLKNTIDAISDVGYNINDNIIIICNDNVYMQFNHKYSIKGNSITRRITVFFKNDKSIAMSETSSEELVEWSDILISNYLKRTSLVIKLNPNHELVSNDSSDTKTKIVDQIFQELAEQDDSVSLFKDKYNKIENINLT